MMPQIETAKTLKRLAQLGGFYPRILRKSHRGLVAKLSLPKLEKYEDLLFEKQLTPLCSHAPIAVNQGGRLLHFINI
jgi:hypothetical protein